MTTPTSKSRSKPSASAGPSAGADLADLGPTNPHNAIFSFALGQKHAIGLLRASLPKEFVDRLDFSSLKRLPADFVDARLKWRYSDLLFSVKAKGGDKEVLVYVLVEHQSKKGRVEGQAALVLDLLTAKFGPLSTAVTARVKRAKAAELTSWAQRILTKSTLAETLDTRATGAKASPARKPSSRAR